MRTKSIFPRLTLGNLILWGTLSLALCFFGVPLLWLFLASARTEHSLLTDPPFTLGSWEVLQTTWNNLSGFNNFQILTWARNSLIMSASGVALTLMSVIPGGYALAVTEFRGRKLILVASLISMIMPGAALVLPIFLEISLLGLSNTYFGVILASSFFPFGLYLSFVYFSSSLPRGVIDSARIDGANRLQLFTRIGLPLAGPLVALIAFFSFLNTWTNFFLAYVLLSDDNLFNLPVGLASLISGTGALTDMPSNLDIDIGKPEVILAAVLVVLPAMLVFIIAQRYIRTGALAGAEKG